MMEPKIKIKKPSHTVFSDYANEAATEGRHDPNMEENNDELSCRQKILDTSTQCLTTNNPMLKIPAEKTDLLAKRSRT